MDKKDPVGIKFEQRPIVEGPLVHFSRIRQSIIRDVVEKTTRDFSDAPLDLLLGEALYRERLRLKRDRPNVFTRGRSKKDRALWGKVQGELLKSAAESDRKVLLERTIRHYVDEITGQFNPNVYRFATHAVPWGFGWLLNAASVRRFLPWGLTESLESHLHVTGEIPMLQKLAQKGTILLVPTHQSNIDSILIGYVIYLMALPPFAYGAGLNLYSNPVLSYFMGRLGAYTVDRKKNNAIYKATLKNYSTRILKNGIHSIFFPGGGRSRNGAIESKIKLGLLGTGLDAQIEGILEGNPSPSIFVVPMVTSYHFVLEASSLIEDYLAESGKHRFIITDDELWHPTQVLNFFWKLFSSRSGITVRIGKPLDIFGNFVDGEGKSLGPNGTIVDPVRWLTSCGLLRRDAQRDHEYTQELGERLVERFHKENTVLTSHVVAFSFFETLRTKYPDLDLYRFLRLSLAQRSLPYSDFVAVSNRVFDRLSDLERRNHLYLANDLKSMGLEAWIRDGIRQLGLLHEAAVVRTGDGAIWTEDMNLLYYYRNRLAGYGLSLLTDQVRNKGAPEANDPKGFLA